MWLGATCGAAVAAGMVFIVRGLRPAPSATAGAMVRRLERDSAPASAGTSSAASWGWQVLPERAGQRYLRASGPLGVAREDLEVLEISPGQHAGTRLVGAAGGPLLVGVFVSVLQLLGVHVSAAGPVVLGLLLAAGLWANTDADVRTRARRAREVWRQAVASYLDRVRIALESGTGPAAAAEQAAEFGDTSTDVRIRRALQRARVHGQTPWQGLAALGERLAVDELSLPAAAVARAAEGGVPVADVVRTQADALDDRLTSERQAVANEVTETLRLPSIAVFVVVMALIFFPGMQALASLA